jgi:hypothetical protein
MKTEQGIVIERNIACGGKPWVDRRGGKGARDAEQPRSVTRCGVPRR